MVCKRVCELRFAGNIIWFVFGGAPLALLWLLGSVLFAISVVGAPLSRGAFEMAKLTAWPFGRDVIHVRELDGRGLGSGPIDLLEVASSA